MYNPSSDQNRGIYFPNDEDKEMEEQIMEAKRRRIQDKGKTI